MRGIAATPRQRGFSMISMLFWLAILGGGAVYAYQVVPVYNTSWKVQEMFEGICHNMADAPESEIRDRLPELMRIKYIASDELPQEFYDNLEIHAENGRVEIDSSYHVRVWLIGKPEAAADANGDYDADKLRGMDRVRYQLKQDFAFEPHAATP